ncbi:GroES-like protein [Sanghuangporus baumii]|uniref:GroES-like protein n=1 Tax=Sanghuangporus baumii TaxID=108892 RepID=A0A9Q5HY64_SANBA|nr:GroES-like protein [Sanghuangporus baumii]
MAGQKALILDKPHGEFSVGTRPIPKPGPGELLVKVHATALNPVDWAVRDYNIFVSVYPAVLGIDSAGTVEEIGEGVKGFAKGDRVLHEGHFKNDYGTFQQYTLVPAEITAKIPSNISFDEAASVSLCLVTAAAGLYGHVYYPEGATKYKAPWEEGGEGLYRGKSILVIGGSASVGQYVIQLAKLSGFSPIIATASLHNADLLKSIGATHVIDRKSPDVSAEARKVLNGAPLDVLFDAASRTEQESWGLVAPGGTLIVISRSEIDKNSEKYKDKTVINTVFGSVHFPDLREMGVSLYSKLTVLLESGAIKPNRVEVLPNGLAGIKQWAGTSLSASRYSHIMLAQNYCPRTFSTILVILLSVLQLVLGGSVTEGGACVLSNDKIDSSTHKFVSDCDDRAFCSPLSPSRNSSSSLPYFKTTSTTVSSNNTGFCTRRLCRKDEFPFGFASGEPFIPPSCPRNYFCPDNGSGCQPLLPVNAPCETDRDYQCSPPPKKWSLLASDWNVNGSVCLRSTCISKTLLCEKMKEFGEGCESDRECLSRYCSSSARVCSEPPGMPAKVKPWQYVLTILSVLGAIIAICVFLALGHKRQRLERYYELLEYYHEQTSLRASIISLHAAAAKRLGDEKLHYL